MNPSPTASNDLHRLVSVALLGLAGCGITIVMTSQPEQLTTARTVGAFFGIFLAFVAMAGVLDTVCGA